MSGGLGVCALLEQKIQKEMFDDIEPIIIVRVQRYVSYSYIIQPETRFFFLLYLKKGYQKENLYMEF